MGATQKDAPPATKHFDADKMLRWPHTNMLNPLSVISAAGGSLPMLATLQFQQFQQMQQFNQWQQQQQQFQQLFPPYGQHQFMPFGQPFPHFPYPLNQYANAAPNAAGTSTTNSSPGRPTAHHVSLAEFCIHYKISDSNQAKLQKLEYELGLHIFETFSEKVWKDDPEISFLHAGWGLFMAAHDKYCRDVKAGKWDMVPNTDA